MDEMNMNDEFDDSDMDEEDEKLIQALANGTFGLWRCNMLQQDCDCAHVQRIR